MVFILFHFFFSGRTMSTIIERPFRVTQNPPIPEEDTFIDGIFDGTDIYNDEGETGEESSRSAILLLDFQNEFLKKGGKLHNDVADVLEKTHVLQNVIKLVESAREMDAMIIYSPVVMKEEGTFDGRLTMKVPEKQVEYSEQYGLFTENTWNCEIVHEVEPRNDDIILRDRCDFSAFAGTKLHSYLRDNNVKHFFVV